MVDLHITESGKTYSAKITRIHGQVDPVTKTVQAVAELDEYQEELLPGMSGLASIYKNPTADDENKVGFLQSKLSDDRDSDDK